MRTVLQRLYNVTSGTCNTSTRAKRLPKSSLKVQYGNSNTSVLTLHSFLDKQEVKHLIADHIPKENQYVFVTAQKLILFGYVWGGERKKERKPN